MKINPIMANRLFVTTGTVQPAAEPATVASKGITAGKTDTVSISREGNSQRVFSNMVRDMMRDLEAQDNPVHVEEIRQAVQTGTYSVPSSAVADAILNRAHFGA